MKKPAHFIIIAKIQNPLDNVASVFLGINGFGINVPKEVLAKLHVCESLGERHMRITIFASLASAYE